MEIDLEPTYHSSLSHSHSQPYNLHLFLEHKSIKMLFKSIFQTLAVVALVSEGVDALRLSRAKVLRLRKKVQSCKRVLHVTIIHPRQLGADPDTVSQFPPAYG